MNEKSFHALRAKIAARQQEQAELQTQELGRADVIAGVRAWAQREADAFAAHARTVLRRAAAGQSLHGVMRGSPLALGSVDVAQALAGIGGADVLAEALLRHIDCVPEGTDAASRAERLAVLAAELDELEAREEQAICESEDGPHPYRRRPDARPEIVLALPKP